MPTPDQSPPDVLAEITWLRALASRIVADQARIDDVVQDAALAALSSAQRGDRHSPDGLRKWLGGVVRNVHRAQRRKAENQSQRERQAARAEATTPTDDLAVRAERSKALLAAVLELPPAMREVILLRHFEDLSPAQIANRLDAPASTVRARLTRAHQTLRGRLGDDFGGPQGLALALIPLVDPSRLAAQLAVPSTALVSAGSLLSLVMTSKATLVILTVVALIGGGVLFESLRSVEHERAELALADEQAQGSSLEERTAALTSVTEPNDRREGAASVHRNSETPLESLASEASCIVGEVFTASGPLIGAAVALDEDVPRSVGVLERKAPESKSTRSGTNGRFRFEVREGVRYRLRVEHDALAPLFVAQTVAGDVHQLEMTAGGALALTVVDGDGAPLQGIECRVIRRGSGWTSASVTNAHGALLFKRLPIGDVLAVAEAPRDTLVKAHRSVRITEGLGALRLELVPAGVMLGEVRDRSTGAAIPGAAVTHGGRTETTGADGRFRFGGFLPGAEGTTGLKAIAPGYRPAATEFRPPHRPVETPLLIELERAQRAHLRVVDTAGAAVAGALVTATTLVRSSQFSGATIDIRAVSDGDGVARFDSMTPDARHDVVAIAEGYGAGIRIVTPTSTNASCDLGEVTLSAACGIAGRVETVLEAFGFVVLERVDDGQSMRVDSLPATTDGRFAFDGIAAGDWRLAYHRRGKGGFALEEPALYYRDVTLLPGERRDNVTISADGSFVGRTVNEAGDAAGNVFVILESADGMRVEGSTNREGRFALPFPGDGPFAVEIVDDGLNYAPWRQSGLALDAPLTIELAALSTEYEIAGQLVMPSDEPLPKGVYVHFTHIPSGRHLGRVGVPDSTGWFTMKNLDNVAYDLSLVDFDKLFQPISIKGVRPDGDAVEMVLERK